jgi:puromycin-sensitive aminopeptidase
MPCFDEPCFKAIFSVKALVTHPRHIAISNTLSKIVDTPEGIWYTFEETPLMSTYLLVIAIGKFDFDELYSKNGIRVRSYTPEGLSK